MSQSAANLKITQKMSPLLPLAGLPRRKLTAAEMQIAAARVKEQTEQRVKLGKKLFSAAESHTNRTQKMIDGLKADQEKFAKLLRGDVAKTLRSYDRWMGKLDEHVTEEVAKLNQRLGSMEVKWSQAEDRLKAVSEENKQLIKQMNQSQERHQEQTKRLMINTFKSLIEKNAFGAKSSKEEVVAMAKEEVCITDSMSLAEINAMKPVRIGPGQKRNNSEPTDFQQTEDEALNDADEIKPEPCDSEQTSTINFDSIKLSDEETDWMAEDAELNLRLVKAEADEDSEINLPDTNWQYDFEFTEDTEGTENLENQATPLRNMAEETCSEDAESDQAMQAELEIDDEVATAAKTELSEDSDIQAAHNTTNESIIKTAEAVSSITQDLATELEDEMPQASIKATEDATVQSNLIAGEIQDLLQTGTECGVDHLTDEVKCDEFQDQVQHQFTDLEDEIEQISKVDTPQGSPLSEQLSAIGVKQLLLDMLSDADVVAKLRNDQCNSETLADAASKEIEQHQDDVQLGLEATDKIDAPKQPAPAHHIYRQVRKWMNGG